MISNANQHIESFLDYYCDLEDAPGYAVMLDGPWGSGKTWFISRYKEKLEKDQKKTIYVSLYGLSSTHEIDQAIFQALHPILSHKATRFAGRFIKTALKATIKFDLDGDKKDDAINVSVPDINLPDYLSNADKHVLLFDDLERTHIQTNLLLGYINHFIEHEGMKCVLISNENELRIKTDAEADKSYLEIRDKVIGKRFEFTSDVSSAIEDFINSPACNQSKAVLAEYIDTIKSIYSRAGYENFRHLKQAIWDFERLYTNLLAKEISEPQVIKHILETHLFLSFEIRAGKLEPDDIASIGTLPLLRLLKKDNFSEKEKLVSSILSKYSGLNATDLLPDKEFWRLFFTKGQIEAELALQSIKNSKYRVAENTPGWVTLWHCMDVSDKEFEKVLASVKLEFKNRTYADLGVLLHVVTIFLWLSDVGLMPETKALILEDAKKYIDHMLESGSFSDQRKMNLDSLETGYLGLGYRSVEAVEFVEFLNYTKLAQEKATEKNIPQEIESLLQEMHSDFELFIRRLILSNSEDNLYYDKPILASIAPRDFFDKFDGVPESERREFFRVLRGRYAYPQFHTSLSSEMPWLLELKKLFVEKSINNSGKVSGYIYRLLSNEIDDAIVSLQATNGKS